VAKPTSARMAHWEGRGFYTKGISRLSWPYEVSSAMKELKR